ncbi:rRNA-processing protein UTP23 homolog [Sitophilus oryzae]|uniref:rRNA-processing protein UTP23 homolog n=1 Tax=Sitophilus oryzae TaxID=7048 RepID=A0A6J2YYW0_SITOR|nr:rRNA-processing protein UTP23 homolog [Sitophilus oryzae]
MKIKRYKKVNKNLGFYINTFGFRQPYQLLADGTFCFAALNNKINVVNDIPKYLQGEIKLITTQCAIMEMENLGPKLNGALIILKKYIVHKCGHEGKPVNASKCLLSMVKKGNSNHYIVCTQDRELQDKIRTVTGVPLLYLHIKTPVLEKPSEASIKKAEERISGISEPEIQRIEKLKEKCGLIKDEKVHIRKRKRKGPNPLSCKKKKKGNTEQNNSIHKKDAKSEIEKKKRKRIRLPKHVKEEIIKLP